MSKWHYTCKDTVLFKNDSDPRNGEYLCYDVDTFDYLMNDNDWVSNNDAWEEQQYLIDNADKMLESNNGEFVYIPCDRTAIKIEISILEQELHDSTLDDLMNW